jgi:hypothetical protein
MLFTSHLFPDQTSLPSGLITYHRFTSAENVGNSANNIHTSNKQLQTAKENFRQHYGENLPDTYHGLEERYQGYLATTFPLQKDPKQELYETILRWAKRRKEAVERFVQDSKQYKDLKLEQARRGLRNGFLFLINNDTKPTDLSKSRLTELHEIETGKSLDNAIVQEDYSKVNRLLGGVKEDGAEGNPSALITPSDDPTTPIKNRVLSEMIGNPVGHYRVAKLRGSSSNADAFTGILLSFPFLVSTRQGNPINEMVNEAKNLRLLADLQSRIRGSSLRRKIKQARLLTSEQAPHARTFYSPTQAFQPNLSVSSVRRDASGPFASPSFNGPRLLGERSPNNAFALQPRNTNYGNQSDPPPSAYPLMRLPHTSHSVAGIAPPNPYSGQQLTFMIPHSLLNLLSEKMDNYNKVMAWQYGVAAAFSSPILRDRTSPSLNGLNDDMLRMRLADQRPSGSSGAASIRSRSSRAGSLSRRLTYNLKSPNAYNTY